MTTIKYWLLHPRLWNVLDNPALFYATRFLLVGQQLQTKQLVRQHLAVAPSETVLDVCCGVGEFAEAVDVQYLGVDMNAKFITRARERFRGSLTKTFEVGDVSKLHYPTNHFDKTILVNSLHHFSDDDAARLLEEIRRVTRHLVIIVDADGTPRGLIRRALVAMDRGKFMRTPERLAALISQVFCIEESLRFDVGFYTELMFRCPVVARRMVSGLL